jgi:hypothetical protein
MNLPGALDLARAGRLYPSLILHGGSEASRQEAALTLARTLLCDEAPSARACGRCRHCRRLVWPQEGEQEHFHPDFHVLERDLRTATSAEGARALLRPAQVSPFEARGQVFVVASAETLSAEAADSLLKTLEEPQERSPRHFLLLAPARLDLSATLRSRSLALYLGPSEEADPEAVAKLVDALGEVLEAFARTGAGIYPLAAAEVARKKTSGWEDPRASRPWIATAGALVRLHTEGRLAPALGRPVLELAQALLTASSFRLRGIPPERVLEGLFVRHLLAAGGRATP